MDRQVGEWRGLYVPETPRPVIGKLFSLVEEQDRALHTQLQKVVAEAQAGATGSQYDELVRFLSIVI